MKRFALVLGGVGAAGGIAGDPALASVRGDVMKPVHQWVDNLNMGNGRAAVAACTGDTSIVDEYPPYQWHGAGTCSRWLEDLTAYNESIGLTEGTTTLGKPRRIDISGNHAYVVAPADFRYKLKGRRGAEIGALFTVALRKEQAGWRITGWSWSRPRD